MKTEFKAKFLQHIQQRKQDQGFTLIELLVVIIIIGILSAIALPSFLNQANKAKQSEAKQYISSISKGQQAYYAENTKFAGQISDLGIGLKTGTTNYTYPAPTTSASGAVALANSAAVALKSYSGAVGLVDAGEAKTTQTILCETTTGCTAAVTPNANANGCGAGSVAVTK